jgi:hypothetical protein
MKKMIWITTLFVIFLVFVVPGILASTLKIIPSGDQPGFNSDQRLSIYGQRRVSQRFVSKTENLTAVGTSIRNPNLKNKNKVIFDLYDNNGTLIRTSVLNGQNFQDGDFVKFVFDPIIDSKDKNYSFTLSSPDANPEETIEVFYLGSPTDVILDYTYDDIIHSGGIPIVTFYKPNSKWETIKKVYFN